jgi:hypothetical protein
MQEAAAGNALYDVLNIGLLSAGIGHLLVLQVRAMIIGFYRTVPCMLQLKYTEQDDASDAGCIK